MDMGSLQKSPVTRADELADLLDAVRGLIDTYIQTADTPTPLESADGPIKGTLVDHHEPKELESILSSQLLLPENGGGKDALLSITKDALFKYSVNTWNRGFMDKLYASTNAIGVISELLLAVLNTATHVYQVSPVLTLIEKNTSRQLAELFGLDGPYAGGISQPGGSAANQSSIVIARNTKFPETKTDGYGNKRFVILTSEHGHYSVEKAAQMFGFGSKAVWSVKVDDYGCIIPSELETLIIKAKAEGFTPFYVNATAGTTVLGAYDPINEIADICDRYDLWLHVDGAWGGSVVFSDELRKGRLEGVERANSVTICAHKMLGVPLTCSFLLGKDIRQFHKAMTLPAGYLFHNDGNEDVYDLADITPQCGRRADSLKLYLGWKYYGRAGYARQLEHASTMAQHLYDVLEKRANFVLITKKPVPAFQVVFHWAKNGLLSNDKDEVSNATSRIAKALLARGFMIDFAPGVRGMYFRVVVNRDTRPDTIEGLVDSIEAVAEELDL